MFVGKWFQWLAEWAVGLAGTGEAAGRLVQQDSLALAGPGVPEQRALSPVPQPQTAPRPLRPHLQRRLGRPQ